MNSDATVAPAAARARDLGIPFVGQPGPLNSITDVPGVEVGHCTVVDHRDGKSIQTGVSAIFPLGKEAEDGVHAGLFCFNGTGEFTGAHQIKELGGFFGPLMLTSTTSVGQVSQAVLQWTAARSSDENHRFARMIPVVAETYDGDLNDVWSFPLEPTHVHQALNTARSGPVDEGSVGGGTGMVAFEFKAGIGTASRLCEFNGKTYTVGALVQANFGMREELVIAGVPVGESITDLRPHGFTVHGAEKDGSLLVVIVTDAPLIPSQLERVARRATIGMARTGGFGNPLSGDIFLAMSTANRMSIEGAGTDTYTSIPGHLLGHVFHAAALATEEAIINALVAGRTTETGNGRKVHSLPHERLMTVMQQHGRGRRMPPG